VERVPSGKITSQEVRSLGKPCTAAAMCFASFSSVRLSITSPLIHIAQPSGWCAAAH
jgi:hypothetical protein